MLRSQRETRRRRKKSSRIPSRGSQESSASSTERAVWTKRIHELNTFVRDNSLSTVVETPEQKDSRRRSRSRSEQPRRHKIRRYLHRSRGKRRAEHEEGGSASQASISPFLWSQGTAVPSSRQAPNVYVDHLFDSVANNLSGRPSANPAISTVVESKLSGDPFMFQRLASAIASKSFPTAADCTTTEIETSIDSSSVSEHASFVYEHESSRGHREKSPRTSPASYPPRRRPCPPSTPPPQYLIAQAKSALRKPPPPPPVQKWDDNAGRSCIAYIYIDEDADVDQVVADARNMAPGALIVCCSDFHMAEQVQTALQCEGFDLPTPDWWPKTKRKSSEYFQARMDCVMFGDVIIAGRFSTTKEIEVKDTMTTPDGRCMLVAEVGFNVKTCGQLAIRFAAFGKSDAYFSNDESWDSVTALLERRAVRFFAGRFVDKFLFDASHCPLRAILAEVRLRLQVRLCALSISMGNVTHPETQAKTPQLLVSAVCVLGPVAAISMLSYETSGDRDRVDGFQHDLNKDDINETAIDRSFHWPLISRVFQKPIETNLNCSQKLLMFIGAGTGNRSMKGIQRRKDNLAKRQACMLARKSWRQEVT